MITIQELWRYPVKSMQGERLEQMELTATGPIGDRLYAIRDRATQRILTGRQCPELLLAEARLEGAGVRITLPDGTATGSDDPEAAAVLSSWLGRPVQLDRSAGVGAEFELPVPAEVAEWYGAEAGSTLTLTTPTTAFTDVAHLHLVLGSRLDAMRDRLGGGWAARRFRPNLLLSDPGEAVAEESLQGCRLRTGGALFEVTQGTIRCVMLTKPVSGLPDAEGILRTLATESRARFGLYAKVIEPARLVPGAEVQVVSPAPAQ